MGDKDPLKKSPDANCVRTFLARPKGFEPPASPLGGERSIQLSYRRTTDIFYTTKYTLSILSFKFQFINTNPPDAVRAVNNHALFFLLGALSLKCFFLKLR